MQLQKSICRFGSKTRSTRGLTLLELVAGISVIVAMAGMSLEFLDRFNQQSAHQTTIERMEIIKKALHEYSRDTVVDRMGNSSISTDRNDRGLIVDSNATPIGSFQKTLNGSAFRNPSLSGYLPTYSFTASNLAEIMACAAFIPPDSVDSWGNAIQYCSATDADPSVAATIANQAKAYLWSFGTDGIDDTSSAIDANGDYVQPVNSDDIVFVLDFSREFNAEAQRRVDEINAAIRRSGLITPSSPTSFGRIWSVLTPSPFFLPADNRYRFNPWRKNVIAADVPFYSETTAATLGLTANTYSPVGGWPVAAVEFLKP